MNVKSTVVYAAFTLKGLFTSRDYSDSDYYEFITAWCGNNRCQVQTIRYELDSKCRLHAHGILRCDRFIPKVGKTCPAGWHLYLRPIYNSKWMDYISKEIRSVEEMLYIQSKASYRRCNNLFGHVDMIDPDEYIPTIDQIELYNQWSDAVDEVLRSNSEYYTL